MLMLTSTMQTAEAVTHTTTIITKNVIDLRFQKIRRKRHKKTAMPQRHTDATYFIYKKDVAQSLRVHPPNSLSAKLHRPANAPSYRLQIFAGPYHYFLTPKRYTHSILVIPL